MTLIEAIKSHMDGKRIKVMFDENIENIPLGDLEILAEMGAEFREFETIECKPKEPTRVEEPEKERIKPSDSQLLDWRGQGFTCEEISKMCGFAVSTVYRWFNAIEHDPEEELQNVANDILKS